MAEATGGIQKIKGTIDGVTYYTIMGSEKVYVRKTGGPSKSMIKKAPQFEKLRRNNNEWAGCTKMGSMMRLALGKIIDLADFPIIGAMNAIGKQIQLANTEDEHGKRSLYLSRNKQLLLGFNVSRKQVLESVLRVPITSSLNRELGTAQVIIPAINAEMYLYNYRNLPFYRLKVSMFAVSDVGISVISSKYEATNPNYIDYGAGFNSDWFTTNGHAAEQCIDLKIDLPSNTEHGFPAPNDLTFVLSVGVEFGKVGSNGLPVGVKYAGCGKVVQMG
jgi:hypothetical protein